MILRDLNWAQEGTPGRSRLKEADYAGTSIRMSSPSTLTGKDASLQESSNVFTPVRQSYSQACHGQIRLPSAMLPWPSGPPACGQIPSKARNSPPALQIA